MASGYHLSAVERFNRLPAPSYEKIYADANAILDDIISQCHTLKKPLDHFKQDEQEAIFFISHGCQLLANATILLKSKFAQVLNIYLLVVKGSLSESSVNLLVGFLANALLTNKSSLVTEFMKALSITLHMNGPNVTEDNIHLLLGQEGIFWAYLRNTDLVAKSYVMLCIGNLSLKSADNQRISKEYLQICYSKLLEYLHTLMMDQSDEVEHFRLISATLKAMQNVLSSITMNDGIVEAEIVVTLLKVFLIYGMKNYEATVKHLLKNMPLRHTEKLEGDAQNYPLRKKEKSPMTKKVHPRRSKKSKSKNKSHGSDDLSGDPLGSLSDSFKQFAFTGRVEDASNSSGLLMNWRQPSVAAASSSESEYSDSELGHKEQLQSMLARIRTNAVVTIQFVLKCCDRRSKFACWLILVPEQLSELEPSFLYSLAMEQSVKVRPALLLALMELIDGSKGFLESAMTVTRASSQTTAVRSFTPFSLKLSQSLSVLHETLLTSVNAELTDVAKDRVVKCLAMLILNAPYKKTGAEFLASAITCVCSLLYSKDAPLRQSTLTCLAAAMSVMPGNPQLLCLLQSATMPQPGVDPGSNEDGSSWLVAFCLQQLSSSKDKASDLRFSSECIQLLTVILRTHSSLLKPHQRSEIIDLVCTVYIYATDAAIVSHAIKLLEEISKQYAAHFNCRNMEENSEAIRFWRRMMASPIPYCTRSENEETPPKIQAAVCDWISNIGADIFAALEAREQIYMKTLLIGFTSSSNIVLAAAAIRALGVIVEFPCVKEDLWFVLDVSRLVLDQISHSSLALRMKAAWSLANICDVLGKNNMFYSEFPLQMLLRLLQGAITAACDNERVNSNGVRALGNLLRKFTKDLYSSPAFEPWISKAVDAVAKAVVEGQMKTRWNGCSACQYMFGNEDFPIGTSLWSTKLYTALISSLRDCKNFKVRISAASALSTPTHRSCYGDEKLFNFIWTECLVALENSEDLSDFSEYRYKETLQEQTTALLIHLVGLATACDLSDMRKQLFKHGDAFLYHCQRCFTKLESQLMLDSSSYERSEATTVGYDVEASGKDDDSEHAPSFRDGKDGSTVVYLFGERLDRMRTNLLQIVPVLHSEDLAAVDLLKACLFCDG